MGDYWSDASRDDELMQSMWMGSYNVDSEKIFQETSVGWLNQRLQTESKAKCSTNILELYKRMYN
jgi:hypothetical protein